MNKRILVMLLLLTAAFSAQAQLSFSVQAKAKSEKKYTLFFEIKGSKSIAIYTTNKKLGLTGPIIELVNATGTLAEITGTSTEEIDPIFPTDKSRVYKTGATLNCELDFSSKVPKVLKGRITGFYREDDQFLSFESPFEVTMEGGVDDAESTIDLPNLDLSNPLYDCGSANQGTSGSSAWKIFLLGLAGGLLALLTPCVFPMVPVTVSFFTHRATNRKQAIKNGVLYGGFIFLIYIAASIPFHLVKGLKPELLNNISTSVPLNLVFFLVFLFFALSFFGLFTISLPSSLATGASKQTGIFFMSLTLVIVSFSCTGPILGSLLVGTLSGGAWLLTAGLAGFGVALGLPFGLFAIFPQWLKKLPKSGGWLETFKKSLAFIELALAFKFLSNADLVMHWGILKREVFIGIWVLIFIAMGIYLLNIGEWYRQGKRMISKFRFGLAMGIILFAIYLLPALGPKGHSGLSFLSGFPPPTHYSVYKHNENSTNHRLSPIMNDFEAALKKAKATNKPILIDFTGWACVNCRKMEENVWSKPAIANMLNEKYILLSLYVDDKAELPVSERSTFIRTIGDKWANFQSTHFKQVTQPLYVAITPEGKLLTHPIGYTPNAGQYLEWLKCGVGE